MCESGILQRADGSAEWTQEQTCVLAAVYGPHQTAPRREHPERAIVDVSFRPAAGVPGTAWLEHSASSKPSVPRFLVRYGWLPAYPSKCSS